MIGGNADLYLAILPVNRAALISLAVKRRTIPRSGDLGYALHQVLTESFGDAAPKPFHLFDDGGCHLVAYSRCSAEELTAAARSAPRTQASDIVSLSDVQAAPMPHFARGQRFRFTVRTRPVCRISNAKHRNLPRECDVFLKAIASKTPGEETHFDRREVYLSWFRRQFPESVARTGGVSISQMTRTQVYRKSPRPIEGPDVTFIGTLEITDPQAFASLLRHGIGRHRAFGFGMLILAAAGSATESVAA